VKWKVPARMSRQPLPHLWMFVGRVIVDDCVDHFFPQGTCASIVLRKRMNSWCRLALHVCGR